MTPICARISVTVIFFRTLISDRIAVRAIVEEVFLHDLILRDVSGLVVSALIAQLLIGERLILAGSSRAANCRAASRDRTQAAGRPRTSRRSRRPRGIAGLLVAFAICIAGSGARPNDEEGQTSA